MNDFGKREVFIDIIKLKRQYKLACMVIVIILPICLGVAIWENSRRMLYASGVLLSLLSVIWFSFYKNGNFFEKNPYLMLDEEGVTFQTKTASERILWKDIKMIDIKMQISTNGHKFYYAIDTTTHEYVLNQGLLAEKFDET